MAVEANKVLVRRFIKEVINRGELPVADELFAAGHVFHGPGMRLHGPDGMRGLATMLRAGFPDWAETIEDLLAEGDRVVVRLLGSGTHTGQFMGLRPTGRPVLVSGIAIFRVRDGTTVEGWGLSDLLGLLQQLGAVPAPDQARQ